MLRAKSVGKKFQASKTKPKLAHFRKTDTTKNSGIQKGQTPRGWHPTKPNPKTGLSAKNQPTKQPPKMRDNPARTESQSANQNGNNHQTHYKILKQLVYRTL